MVTQNTNPFVLPGFGQTGDMAQNPIMASMEMMRQAWQGLASTGGMGAAGMSAPASVEDLERRIADLRAVENWLRMNLSMLSSTIQGLEVQRSTIATLKSFMTSAAGAASNPKSPSPLEAALGMMPAMGGSSPDTTPKNTRGAQAKTDAAGSAEAQAPTDADQAGVAAAAQGWWDLVQKQFDTLAAATTASLQGAENVKAAAQQAAASADTTLGKARATTQGADKAKAAAPRKTATRKAAARKRAPAAGKQ